MFDSCSLEESLQPYPYIPKKKIEDLHSIGATDVELSRINQECKDKTDRQLRGYSLEQSSKYDIAQEVRKSGRLTVAVIGFSGAGKSATGNTLLGEQRFFTGSSASVVNMEQAESIADMDNPIHMVIDTPGSWYIPRQTPADLYVFVINLAGPRLSQRNLQSVRQLKDHSRIVANNRCVLLLTHAKEALHHDSRTLTDYLSDIRGEPLYNFITNDLATWRVLAINNICQTKYEENSQRKMILDLLIKAHSQAQHTGGAGPHIGVRLENKSELLDLLPCSMEDRYDRYVVWGVGGFLLFVFMVGIIMVATETAPVGP